MQAKLISYFSRLFNFFILATIGWGLLFGLWLGLYVGIGKGLLYGIGGGLIVAFVITFIGALYDYLIRRKVFAKYGKKSFDVMQIREIFFKGDIKDIFQKSVTALKKIHKIKHISPNSGVNKIVATTDTTWKTFGEKIEIEFFQEVDRIRVQVCSKPRFRTAIFDCGKNIENVEILSSLLKSEMI